ncbi:Zinc finger RING-type [Arabidopsis thaliana x Arabidopsis arenosa]|uniref:Zinc finger RING-type n=1 Tax=Arabidopsis thaliana x Arabidopsis arenosa TaxID=1240361 RepID=A0A8T2A8B7_9BRAS|nr:Zinc finger RING-type [Arabidopsis thaliana x Arabidopsis arenosa]
MTTRFLQFIGALQISRESQTSLPILIYFKVTDYNFQANSRIDTDILIAELQTSKRKPTTNEENEDCIICLQTFKGRQDINSLACNHIYHHECISTWLYANKICPICRATDL